MLAQQTVNSFHVITIQHTDFKTHILETLKSKHLQGVRTVRLHWEFPPSWHAPKRLGKGIRGKKKEGRKEKWKRTEAALGAVRLLPCAPKASQSSHATKGSQPSYLPALGAWHLLAWRQTSMECVTTRHAGYLKAMFLTRWNPPDCFGSEWALCDSAGGLGGHSWPAFVLWWTVYPWERPNPVACSRCHSTSCLVPLFLCRSPAPRCE